jgi:hypothetical protein
VAEAKDVPDSLKQEACRRMDATELTGDPMMNSVASLERPDQSRVTPQ